MSTVADELKNLLAFHRPYHSEFQIDHFILGRSGGTLYGCFKQAIRELHGRYRGLKGLYLERAELKAEYSTTQYGPTTKKNVPDFALARLSMRMEDLEANLRDTEREFWRFFAHAKALRKRLGELTPETCAKLEEEFWVHKVRCMLAVDLMVSGSAREATVELLNSMPRELRREVTRELTESIGRPEGKKALLQWYEDLDVPLPALEPESHECFKPGATQALLGLA